MRLVRQRRWAGCYPPRMPDLALRQPEARLLYLATLYHLGRPGSEVDAVTRRPLEAGLGPVRAALEAQLDVAAASVDLTDFQVWRLAEALLGLVNELKQIGLSGRSVTPGLVEALTRLYPEITTEEPSAAFDVAGAATLLRRRLDGTIRAAAARLEATGAERAAAGDAPERSHGGWRFWRR
jgi:hypothetical protein